MTPLLESAIDEARLPCHLRAQKAMNYDMTIMDALQTEGSLNLASQHHIIASPWPMHIYLFLDAFRLYFMSLLTSLHTTTFWHLTLHLSHLECSWYEYCTLIVVILFISLNFIYDNKVLVPPPMPQGYNEIFFLPSARIQSGCSYFEPFWMRW